MTDFERLQGSRQEIIPIAQVGAGPIRAVGDKQDYERRRGDFYDLMRERRVIGLPNGFIMAPDDVFDPERPFYSPVYLEGPEYVSHLTRRIMPYSALDHDADHGPAYEQAFGVAGFGDLIQATALSNQGDESAKSATGKISEFANKHKNVWRGSSPDRPGGRILLRHVAYAAYHGRSPIQPDPQPNWLKAVDPMIPGLGLSDEQSAG
jgi:hypothetical protein